MSRGPLNPDINPLYCSPKTIPEQYWQRLKNVYDESIIDFVFLSHPAKLDIDSKSIYFTLNIEHTYQLYLVVLYYLYLKKNQPFKLDENWILPNELKGGMHFFKDSHPINTEEVIKCFKNKKVIEGVMKKINAMPVNLGDLGFVVSFFEDVFIRYIFWEGDEDFEDTLTINVQKNLEDFFPLDVVWAMINVLNQAIVYLSKI
ncbi:MAG: DUF3786 domain-containing protein [Proteobacteria bacterium]|nr:DUF3786 domain-containing protein [Pseudomonadota bacterium]